MMSKKKTCIHCGKELFCRECGESQTPRKEWKRTSMQFSPEMLESIDKAAEKAGVSRVEYVRSMVGRVLDLPQNDPLCDSDEE